MLLVPVSICVAVRVVDLNLAYFVVEWLEGGFPIDYLFLFILVLLWFLTHLQLVVVLSLRNTTHFYFGRPHFIEHGVLPLLLHHNIPDLEGVIFLLLLHLSIFIRGIIHQIVVPMLHSLVGPQLLPLARELKRQILIRSLVLWPVLGLRNVNDVHALIPHVLVLKLLMVSRLLLIVLVVVLQPKPLGYLLLTLSLASIAMSIPILIVQVLWLGLLNVFTV